MTLAAVTVAALALLFTVASFWWLNARRGKLKTYEPTTWATYIDRNRSALRLPLVLHNTGAAAMVVIALRLRFDEGHETMAWEWTRTRVNPSKDDTQDVTVPLSIDGRNTRELVPEFVGTYPGTVPEQRTYPVTIEARTSHNERWHPILRFGLELANLTHPTNYIVYTNERGYLTDDEQRRGAQALGKLRHQYGIKPEGTEPD